MKHWGYYVSVGLLPLALIACSSTPASNTYTSSQAGTLQEVQFVTIAGVRMITIQEDNADAGKIAGGLMGGSAGSTLGQGTGQFMGSVAGAMIGSTVGMVTDRNAQAQQGLELIVRIKDSNKTVAIAQISDENFKVGDEVKVIATKEGKARVTH